MGPEGFLEEVGHAGSSQCKVWEHIPGWETSVRSGVPITLIQSTFVCLITAVTNDYALCGAEHPS